MKGIYISLERNDISSRQGVVKKAKAQIHAFNNSSIGMYYGYFSDKIHYIIDDNGIIKKSLETAEVHHPGWRKAVYDFILKTADETGTSFVYMRKPPIDFNLLSFLKKLKNKNIKIVFEFPTYPFICEMEKNIKLSRDITSKIKSFIILCITFILQYRLKKYVSVFTSCARCDRILGLQSIYVPNGIDLSSDEYSLSCDEDGDRIHMIAVASMKPWHGYERILEGLKNYNGSRKVILDLVGDGIEIQKYAELTKKYHLEDSVFFHGCKSGAELGKIYMQANIALDCFMTHIKNIHLSSTLKTREYVLNGLPIVSECEVDLFPSDSTEFVYKVPEDETPVDINEIINWYLNLRRRYPSKLQMAQEIHNIAVEKCDINITMRPVINCVKENA